MTTNKDALEGIATEYVYSHHGRGLSTSVGINTRAHIKNAFIAGYEKALQTQAELVEALRGCVNWFGNRYMCDATETCPFKDISEQKQPIQAAMKAITKAEQGVE